MAGVKRKSSGEPNVQKHGKVDKMLKVAVEGAYKPSKHQPVRRSVKFSNRISAKREEAKESAGSDDIVESDTTEEYNGLNRFSDTEVEQDTAGTDIDENDEDGGVTLPDTKLGANGDSKKPTKVLQDGQSSKETHAKQKALAKERKSAKPNADSIHRSKKLWERLRRKSHVPKQEREVLVAELYDIITGRIKDFVFKHDSVRVVQCALKYANMQQRKMIANELKGEYKTLAESRYAKFLIGKILVEGDAEIRDLIIPEFYGHVRRMINHPEASWIVDDIYRQIATTDQKARLLREWYGAEFAIFKDLNTNGSTSKVTAKLSTILASTPEKRKPIISYLFQLINQLIQKRLTAFTLLHDAMLQYFLNISPASEEYVAFVDLLRPDPSDESDSAPDLLKNLAFTPSGSRLVCLILAHSTAKDRRAFLKVFKDNIQLMAYDPNAHTILLTAYTVVDDTREVTKTIVAELVGVRPADEATDTTLDTIVQLATHLVARRTLLYPLVGSTKALLSVPLQKHIDEVRAASLETSKKQPAIRAAELSRALLPRLFAATAARASDLLASSFGVQAITDALLSPHADPQDKGPAADAVATLATGSLADPEHPFREDRPWAGRMLKTLVLGGHFDAEAQGIVRCEGWAEVGFPKLLWPRVKDEAVAWATGGSSFVMVNLLEVGEEDGGLGEEEKREFTGKLKKVRKALEEAAVGRDDTEAGKKAKKAKNGDRAGAKERIKGNSGAKMLLEKLK